jgi:transcriptional regulator PpsR
LTTDSLPAADADSAPTADGRIDFTAPATTLGAFDPGLAARLTAVAADIALVIDGDGVIRDVAIASPDLAREPLVPLLGRRWIETVGADSEFKIADMLRTTPRHGLGRWRIVNQRRSDGDTTVTLRFMTVGTGDDGRVIALGRDLRATAAMQQRLLQTQQSMERDYLRLRQAESRYRLLFDLSAEAVLIVDAATNRFVEVNPAARRLIGSDTATAAGALFTGVFEAGSRDRAGALLAAAAASASADPVEVRLAPGGRDCRLSASLYRQDKATYVLARLTPVVDAGAPDDGRQMLIDVLERLPDAFVVTDRNLDILAENAAFLDLAQFARREHARGQSLRRFLGRPGIDVDLIVAHLEDAGSVRNFTTIFRSQLDAVDEVEVSAVAVTESEHPCFGFAIRSVGRRLRDDDAAGSAPGRDLPRSVEQLTELVGRVSLKEIVRESTDLIERLCIEAALAYTDDNRASAAEILGLSRQSLYSKLHRHGLGNLAGGEE